MKKILLLSLVGFSATAFAQSTIELKDLDNNLVLAPNATINAVTQSETSTHVNLDIKNIGAASESFIAKRYNVLLNTDAVAYFCFAGTCYGDQTFVSPTSLTLTAGQSASSVPGSFNNLTAYLDEALVAGSSVIKYTFVNETNANDSFQVTIKYGPMPVGSFNFTTTLGFSGVNSSSGLIDPTPTPTAVGFNLSSFAASGTSANSTKTGAFSFSGWPTGGVNGDDTPSSMTGTIDTDKYYSITVTPQSGFFVSLYSVTFDVNRSADGMRNYAVRSSIDSYAANLPAEVISNTNLSVVSTNKFLWNLDATVGLQSGSKINLPQGDFLNLTNATTFRFYGWNSESASGTFEIDNVSFQGIASTEATGIGTISYDLNSKIKVYPNPSADGNITVSASIKYSKIQILNAIGQVVSISNGNDFNNQAATLNLTDLSSGVYYVQLFTPKGIATEKLVITK